MKKKHIHISIALFFISVSISYCQRLSPYQPGAYYPGVESTRDMAAVDPGFYFINYSYWLNTQGYYDRNGNQFDGGIINNVDIASPKITAFIDVPLFFYCTPFKLFGAYYLVSATPVYLSSSQSAFISVGDSALNLSSSMRGFGDFSFMPFGLSWSDGERYDVSFMYTIYTPTGRFEIGASDNLGQGFWTHQLQVPFYFYLNQKATGFMVIPTIELNGKIKEVDFRAGNRLSLEYGISQYITEWLEVDLLNGHNWQLQDDKGKGAWWDDTRLDGLDSKNTFSVGVSAWPISNTLCIRARYIQDYGAMQRFSNRFWSLSALFIPKTKSNQR